MWAPDRGMKAGIMSPASTDIEFGPRTRGELFLGVVGLAAGSIACVLAAHQAREAAAQTWTPFVLVTGLLLVGLAAEDDGLFRAAGRYLARWRGPETALLAAAALLVTVVTATLNLDTAVVFVTPVLLATARQRGTRDAPLLYGALMLANASSLFLPGSNLTNLIVLGRGVSGGAFLARTWPAALSACVVTALVVGVATRRWGDASLPMPGAQPAMTGRWGAVAVAGVVCVVLFVPSPALWVLGIGVLVSTIHLRAKRLSLLRLRATVAPLLLVGLFGLAVSMGTLGRAWGGPATALAHLGLVGTALLGALSSVFINNLPAAALLAARHPPHPTALLVGLNLGPNLCATGSLAWFLWFRIARASGATPSLTRAGRLGLLVVPLTMLAALLCVWAG
jgi:arsenical pump membrane protein